jgi:hypothetical protein
MKANHPGSGPSPAGVELASIDDLAITPLSDDELDSVAGGYTDTTTAASCQCCVSGATDIPQKSPRTTQ